MNVNIPCLLLLQQKADGNESGQQTAAQDATEDPESFKPEGCKPRKLGMKGAAAGAGGLLLLLFAFHPRHTA